MDIKVEPESPSPQSADFDNRLINREPEDDSRPGILEQTDIKVEPDINVEAAPMLANTDTYNDDLTHFLSHLRNGDDPNECDHPSHVPFVGLNHGVTNRSPNWHRWLNRTIARYRIPTPKPIANSGNGQVAHPSRPTSPFIPTTHRTISTELETAGPSTTAATSSRSSSSLSSASSNPPSTANPKTKTVQLLAPALPISSRPTRPVPIAPSSNNLPSVSDISLDLDPFGYGLVFNHPWANAGPAPQPDNHDAAGGASWLGECETILGQARGLQWRRPLIGTAQERTRAAIYLRQLIGKWFRLVFDNRLLGDPQTVSTSLINAGQLANVADVQDLAVRQSDHTFLRMRLDASVLDFLAG
jgi:hypothetical protein